MSELSSPNVTESNYWGFWGTIGFGFFAFAVFGILQSIIIFAYAFWSGKITPELLAKSGEESQKALENIAYNGDLISLAEIPAAAIGMFLIIQFVISKRTISTSHYLDLKQPKQPIKIYFFWIAIMMLTFITMETVNTILEHETPEFMSKVYASTNNKFLLWIAVAVAAPLFEEFLFRGFLLEGLRRTFLGVVGAILITSASWAIIHGQYGWYEIITIFFIGIIFSVAKLKTQSLYVPIAMHMFMNLTASIMMEFAPPS